MSVWNPCGQKEEGLTEAWESDGSCEFVYIWIRKAPMGHSEFLVLEFQKEQLFSFADDILPRGRRIASV